MTQPSRTAAVVLALSLAASAAMAQSTLPTVPGAATGGLDPAIQARLNGLQVEFDRVEQELVALENLSAKNVRDVAELQRKQCEISRQMLAIDSQRPRDARGLNSADVSRLDSVVAGKC